MNYSEAITETQAPTFEIDTESFLNSLFGDIEAAAVPASQIVCFGIPSVFSFTSTECKKCPDHLSCQSAAHKKLRTAPVEIVGKLLAQHEAHAIALSSTKPTKEVRTSTKAIEIDPSAIVKASRDADPLQCCA